MSKANNYPIVEGALYRHYEIWGYMTVLEISNVRPEVATLTFFYSSMGINTFQDVSHDRVRRIINSGDFIPMECPPAYKLSGQKVFQVYADPSHAYLKVKQDDLKALGVYDDISNCSTVRGEYAYLEEDDDMPRFLSAWKLATGNEPDFRFNHSDSRCKVRDYYDITPLALCILSNGQEILV